VRNGGWSERNCSHMLEDGFTDWNTPVLVRSQFKLLGSIMVYRLLGVIYPPCPLLILSYSRAVFLISHYDTIPPPPGPRSSAGAADCTRSAFDARHTPGPSVLDNCSSEESPVGRAIKFKLANHG